MTFTVRKSLIIGLGGTGRDAVLHAKHRCLEVFGEVPPTTRFYVIDTTDPEPLRLKNGEQINLGYGEFRKLTVRDPGTLIRTNPEVKSWFPDEVPQRSITNGAGQIRALGRLALYSDPRLRNALKNLLDDINAWDVTRTSKYQLFGQGDKLFVSLVTSLAGGTGSGSYLDVAFLIRDLLQSTDVLTGYLLLPDVFENKPATRNVAPNAYAALRELDYFMDRKSTQEDYFVFGGHNITIDRPPLDVIYLVNNVTSFGTVYGDISDLTEFLGRGLFMAMGASGKTAADVWDNLQSQLVGQHRWHGKSAYLASFGLSELVYSPERFVKQFTCGLGSDLVRKLFLGQQPDVSEQLETFMRQNKLREEGPTHNEVIDRLVKHYEPELFEPPQRADRRSLERMLKERPTYLQRMRDRVNTESEVGFQLIYNEVVANLGDMIRDRLNQDNGLAFCKSFLHVLKGRLSTLEKEIESERDQFDEKLRQEEALCREIDRERGEVRDFFIPSSAWGDLAERLEECAVRQAKWELEKTRRVQAVRLFQSISARLTQQIEHLDKLRSMAEALVSDFNQELEVVRRNQPQDEPFVKTFEPPNVQNSTETVPLSDFLNWLARRGTTISNFTSMQIQEVKKLLLEYGEGLELVRGAKSRTIEEVLRGMNPKDRYEQISNLARMAEPLWAYNKARTVGEHATDVLYLFGTATEEGSIFNDGDLAAHLDSRDYEPQIVTTGDPRRITCLKIEAAVPAFILDGMSQYRARFFNKNRPFTYHTSEVFDNIPDLFPITEEEAKQKWWALALADPFNLIERRGEYYFFRSKKLGRITEEYMVKLAQGRAESMNKFLKNSEMIEETMQVIERVLREKGNRSVNDAIVSWMRKQEEEYRGIKMKREIRDLIERELSDLEIFIKEFFEEMR